MVQTLSVLEVSPDELHGYVALSEYMAPVAWAAVYEDGEIVGYGCVSRLHGQVWAHDLKHWGTNNTAVIQLYRLLIRLCKERGVSKVLTDVTDTKMMRLYRSLGWSPKSVILEGEI